MAIRRFLVGAVGELKKVEWPTREHLIAGVAAVIVFSTIVGIYLYSSDLLSQRIVHLWLH